MIPKMKIVHLDIFEQSLELLYQGINEKSNFSFAKTEEKLD
jgi:hypothetical protein